MQEPRNGAIVQRLHCTVVCTASAEPAGKHFSLQCVTWEKQCCHSLLREQKEDHGNYSLAATVMPPKPLYISHLVRVILAALLIITGISTGENFVFSYTGTAQKLYRQVL